MAKTGTKSSVKKKKRYHMELSSFSVLLWSIFSFFFLTWIFVLGIMVGRGFLPGSVTTITDLRSQIKKLQEMVSHKESYEPKSMKGDDETPKLAFYEKLENKKNEVKNNQKQDNQSDTGKDISSPPEEIEMKERSDTEDIEKKVDAIGLPEQKMEFLIPESGYTVQVASIGDMVKAEEMIKGLREKGYDAYYYEVKVDGKYYYRIRCGRFSTRNEADIYAQKLEKELNMKGFVSKID